MRPSEEPLEGPFASALVWTLAGLGCASLLSIAYQDTVERFAQAAGLDISLDTDMVLALTPEQLNALARAAYLAFVIEGHAYPTDWTNLPQSAKTIWRGIAMAVVGEAELQGLLTEDLPQARSPHLDH
jgi:hypothetical protein